MKNVSVTGVGMTKFGKRRESLKSLAVSACRDALIDAGKPKVDAIYAGNFLGGQLAGQEIIGSILSKELGLGPIPTTKTEGACASGGIAFRQAYLMVDAGIYDTVLVVGVEKMTHAPTNLVTQAINSAMDNDSNEGISGLTFPGFFGVVANRYMYEFGAGKEHLARVALKNREYAMNNPKAQFRKETSLEEIMGARPITAPLGLFDCSPITDGAAAVILTAGDKGVKVLASGQASGPPLMQDIPNLLEIVAIRESARQAYEQASLGPNDMDVVELHDCFAMTEILAIEDLGLFEKGTGWQAIESGLTKHGGSVPVNTSGGLLSRGHPIGATGVSQIVQIVCQLRGSAVNQVDGARIGLAQNLGGTGAYSTVHIFEGSRA
ncbi:thiolase C-terminal domain-containing protein [Peribacillus frigoritolerans]|uniref:thiolase C-terminal domain-containing protein n=1 Tax=Peribacillus frigoritolerans TaxID=450367 RepID=UPI002E2388A6|nr:thiolase domain-containing protein [Peribacillus frigoritolerans]MED3845630.1 thiolase domain-containing protein [Peribacillus frigoritolerans]WVN11895.1 thiolase domain-containing protein [Peribacillus frigoritolerans]